MPDLRIDPLTGLRTIVAGERAERPGGWPSPEEEPPLDPERDPFLEGHEGRTPPEIWADRPGGGAKDGPGWTVRVVPNLYPALAPSEDGSAAADRRGGASSRSSGSGTAPGDPLDADRGEPNLFPSRPAVGAHEVIVNAPQPATSLLGLEPAQAARAMEAWRERIRAHASASYVHLIVNEGRRAGASLPHTHAQLYALSFVPAAVARERERFTAYANRTHGRNLLADVVQEEVRRRDRVVVIDDEAVALCPFASRGPFQVMIVPRRPRERFEEEGPLGTAVVQDVLARLTRVLGATPPLNMWVRTAPRGAEHFCWRIDLLPRLVNDAGLELGVGVNLNIVAPERAAELLRG